MLSLVQYSNNQFNLTEYNADSKKCYFFQVTTVNLLFYLRQYYLKNYTAEMQCLRMI